jgi:hypothetical protein
MGLGKSYELTDVVLFGKYKDKTIEEIINIDVEYITYLIEHHEFELTMEALNYYHEKI